MKTRHHEHLILRRILTGLVLLALAVPAIAEKTPDATTILKAAMEQWRGTRSSESVFTMTIQRPDWRRQMSMRIWSEGDKRSLVRVLEPKKDAGSGTLLIDNKMWSYTPKINRIIKIPSSMMSQSWMGSDFTNKDISRSTDILEQYTHRVLGTETHEGHTVYVIESIPKESAPIVWGKEIIRVRDDYVMLEHTFYDQDMKPVKSMRTLKIGMLDGRKVALVQRMQKTNTPNEWTEVRIVSAKFNIPLRKGLFTLSSLRNPRS